MRKFSIEEGLRKNLSKISRKDKILYTAIMKKIEEILTCDDVNHYKNLKQPLRDFKRVHVKSSFVLTFKCIESEDKVVFYRLKHHDDIYK